MANQEIGAVFQDLNNHLKGLSNAVSTQGISQLIPSYDGIPSKFKEWIKNIEKYSLLMNIPHGRIKLITYQTSSGSVSSFLKRLLENNENLTWPQVKAELATVFAEITDSQHAFLLLRKCKQKQGESVQIFAERLLALAEEAYANESSGAKIIDRQLVGFFIDGLYHDYLKLKVMRENPDNFQTAIQIAQNEQNLRKRFDLRSGNRNKNGNHTIDEEILADVNYYKTQRYCYYCNKQGHLKRNCRSKKICWNCQKLGHIKRNCQNKTKKNRNNNTSQNKKQEILNALFMLKPIKSAN